MPQTTTKPRNIPTRHPSQTPFSGLLSSRSPKASFSPCTPLDTTLSNVKHTQTHYKDSLSTREPAKPMVIPMSNSSRTLHHGAGSSVSERRVHHRSSKHHKGVPPAVAALLAITSIPPPSKNRRTRYELVEEKFGTTVSTTTEEILNGGDDLIYTDLFGDDGPFLETPSALSRSSSMAGLSILSSSAGDELDELCAESLSRSMSSDSVPSLEDDSDSSLSWNGPSTPNLRSNTLRKRAIERRARIMTSPIEEVFEHPLLASSEVEAQMETAWLEQKVVNTSSLPASISKALSFKSNLTASLRVLKSAAKTFTSMSAQFVQPDDFLTRSIMSLTPQYRDERRPVFPKQEEDTPVDPALRRYLNRTPPDVCTGMIQLQTYKKTVRRVRSAESRQRERSEALAPPPRQREIRENSDFLRVIVLEMNMRRVGKLSDTVGGKARLVLPPRKLQKPTRAVGDASYWEAMAI